MTDLLRLRKALAMALDLFAKIMSFIVKAEEAFMNYLIASRGSGDRLILDCPAKRILSRFAEIDSIALKFILGRVLVM